MKKLAFKKDEGFWLVHDMGRIPKEAARFKTVQDEMKRTTVYIDVASTLQIVTDGESSARIQVPRLVFTVRETLCEQGGTTCYDPTTFHQYCADPGKFGSTGYLDPAVVSSVFAEIPNLQGVKSWWAPFISRNIGDNGKICWGKQGHPAMMHIVRHFWERPFTEIYYPRGLDHLSAERPRPTEKIVADLAAAMKGEPRPFTDAYDTRLWRKVGEPWPGGEAGWIQNDRRRVVLVDYLRDISTRAARPGHVVFERDDYRNGGYVKAYREVGQWLAEVKGDQAVCEVGTFQMEAS